MSYTAPVSHIRFVLEKIAGFQQVRALPAFRDVTPDVVEAVLEGAGRFASDVLDPINASGDRVGSHVTPQGVVTPAGFKEAYQRFVDDGWNSLGGPTAYGGQGMPFILHAATVEMWGVQNSVVALLRRSSSMLPRSSEIVSCQNLLVANGLAPCASRSHSQALICRR